MSGNDHIETGIQAEQLACQHLQAHGLLLRDRNYHCPAGEIDLIMQDADSLVFVEVRFRKNSHFGNGAESITRQKRRKIIATASHYLQHSRSRHACRFDVVSISGGRKQPDIEWIRNAFTT